MIEVEKEVLIGLCKRINKLADQLKSLEYDIEELYEPFSAGKEYAKLHNLPYEDSV